ncbi:MAG TPA: polyprenol monophosphomannose synthase [Planctomycetota bacterium]|nr:polyprenol monophosphomannose synthase [Planctomycetota bacterium]
MQLKVVLPTYNEAENLPRMVAELLALPLPGARLSILVVDDNSPDGTGAIADRLAAGSSGRVTVLHRPGKEGLARAYLAGIQQALDAGADLVLQMDCDFSHPPRFIPDLLAALPEADLVVGSRYVAGGRLDPEWAWWRKLLSWFANSVYVRTILGIPVHDATGGFRLWRRQTLSGMDLQRRIGSTGYVFLVELSYVAWRLGYRIREVPIEFPDRAAGDSKMNFAIQLEAARRVFEVRRRHRGLTPGDRVGR